MLSSLFLRKHAPRWFIFSLDAFLSAVSILAAFLLYYNFNIPEEVIGKKFFVAVGVVIGFRILLFSMTRTYAGIVRYTSTKDTERIIMVTLSGTAFFILVNILNYHYNNSEYLYPFAVLIIDFLLSVVLLTAFRLFVKGVHSRILNDATPKNNVIIYGSERFASITKRSIDRDPANTFKVVAFLGNKGSAGKKLDGAPVFQTGSLSHVADRYSASHLIIAKEDTDLTEQERVVDICLHQQIKILQVPEVSNWINGQLNVNQIKKIRIEDLLGREPIQLDEQKISEESKDQVILVTGAAGSIGGGLVRQLARYVPAKIILFDQAESPLYDIELELKEKIGFSNHVIEIGDITNERRMRDVFKKYRPAVVYHAAAYKHVPMMEEHPEEAIHNNILGSKLLADLSNTYKARKFVMISTDKAVNPTNVMGASKRIAEMYIQSLNAQSKTRFITTRFGNVLGSNGSVIPRFKAQIEEGGPVTVTDAEVTRYFMTIPEACQLVLEASAFGEGGEIFVFDMGKAVKIVDLAKKMIRLSGFEVKKDVAIKFTGLRPGEKLYEELLNDKENTLPTHHPQIMRGRVRENDFAVIKQQIGEFTKLLEKGDKMEMVRQMKMIVPEFLSHNSLYQRLDEAKRNHKNVYAGMAN